MAKKEYTLPISQEELSNLPILRPLSLKHEQFMNCQSDIVLFGGSAGSGKSQTALYRLLSQSYFDKDFVGAVAMASQKSIKGAGSIWSTGSRLFEAYGAKTNSVEQRITNPNGSQIKMDMAYRNQEDWRGTQQTVIAFDEAQLALEDDVLHLMTRLRSQSKQKKQLLMTCNPKRTSFLCRWLVDGGYLDDGGYPIESMCGVETYCIQLQGEMKFFKTQAEIEEKYGKKLADVAQTFTFFAANIYDNPYLRKHDPSYVIKLENLKRVERAMLLEGCWFASSESSGYAKRDWFKEVPLTDIPIDLPSVRAWDLAGTLPSETNPDPDWTRGIKCSYDRTDGSFYILDMVSLRDRAAIVEKTLHQTAQKDGRETYVSIPLDAGAAAKARAEQQKASLMTQGNRVVLSKTRTSKLRRAEPFLIALQEGKVHVKRGVFTEENYNEIESFDGEPKSRVHDDLVDALADAYTALTSGELIPSIRIPTDYKKRRRTHRRSPTRRTGKTLLS